MWMELNELQAKLDARKTELSKLQQKISKARKVKRDEPPPKPSLQAAGRLVRQSENPHSPIWLQDHHFPAQYLVRHTRSMTKGAHSSLVVSIPIQHYNVVSKRRPLVPKLPTSIPALEFHLPDTIFQQTKLEKLQQIKSTEKTCLDCEDTNVLLQSSLGEKERELKCDMCLHNKLSNEETKILIAGNNIISVVCVSQYTSWRVLPEHCWSHPLCEGECVLCGEVFESNVFRCTLLAVGGHFQSCTIRVHIFQTVHVDKFFTVDLVTERAHESYGLCMWEEEGSHLWITSYTEGGSVVTWRIDMTDNSSECVCSCDLPQLSALRYIKGAEYQLVASTQDSLVVCDCRTGTVLRDISVMCPNSATVLDAVPVVVAAEVQKGTLFILMSNKSFSTITSKALAWLLAVAEGQNRCTLLQAYQHNSTSATQCQCRHLNSISALLNPTTIAMWHLTHSLPTQTIIFKGDSTVVSYRWLEQSKTLVVLNSKGHVHRFREC